MNIKITAYPHSWCACAIGPYLFSLFKSVDVLLISSFPVQIHLQLWYLLACLGAVINWWMESGKNSPPPPLPFPNVYIVNNFPHQLMTKLQYAWSKLDIKIPYTHIPRVKYTLRGVMDCISCHTFVYILISEKGKRVADT